MARPTPTEAEIVASKTSAAMILGLVMGVVAGIALLVAFVIAVALKNGRVSEMFEDAAVGTIWVAFVGWILAVFPVGPIWIFVAKRLVRQRELAVWPYAAAGTAAASAPVFLLIGLYALAANPVTTFPPETVWPIAWFALSGAIGGGFAGRSIAKLLREHGAHSCASSRVPDS